VVSYLSLPFSGAFAMVDWAPVRFQKLLLYYPQIPAFEMIRGGWFGSQVRAHYDVVYAGWTCGLMIVIGLALTLKVRRYLVIQ